MLGLVFKDYEEYSNTLRGIDIDSIRTVVYYNSRGEPKSLGIAVGDITPKPYVRYDHMPYYLSGNGTKLLIESSYSQALDIKPYGTWYHSSREYTSISAVILALDPEEYIRPVMFASPFKFITPLGVDYLTVSEESVELDYESYEPQLRSDFWFYSDDVKYIPTTEEYTEIVMQDYVKVSDFWFYNGSVQYIGTAEGYVELSSQPYVQESDFWFYSDDVRYVPTTEEYMGLVIQPYIQESDFWFFSDSVQYIPTKEGYQAPSIVTYGQSEEAAEDEDYGFGEDFEGENDEGYGYDDASEDDISIPEDEDGSGDESQEEWGSEDTDDWGDEDISIPDDSKDEGDSEDGWGDEDISIPDDSEEQDDEDYGFGEDSEDEGDLEDSWGDEDIGIPDASEEQGSEEADDWNGAGIGIPDELEDWGSEESEEDTSIPSADESPGEPDTDVSDDTAIWEEPDETPPAVVEAPKVESQTGAVNTDASYKEPVEKPKEIRAYLRMFPHSTRKDLVEAGFTEKVIKKAIGSGKITGKNGVFIPV